MTFSLIPNNGNKPVIFLIRNWKCFSIRRFCIVVVFFLHYIWQFERKIWKRGYNYKYLGGRESNKELSHFHQFNIAFLMCVEQRKSSPDFLVCAVTEKMNPNFQISGHTSLPSSHPSSLLIWQDMKVQSVSSTGKLRL